MEVSGLPVMDNSPVQEWEGFGGGRVESFLFLKRAGLANRNIVVRFPFLLRQLRVSVPENSLNSNSRL